MVWVHRACTSKRLHHFLGLWRLHSLGKGVGITQCLLHLWALHQGSHLRVALANHLNHLRARKEGLDRMWVSEELLDFRIRHHLRHLGIVHHLSHSHLLRLRLKLWCQWLLLLLLLRLGCLNQLLKLCHSLRLWLCLGLGMHLCLCSLNQLLNLVHLLWLLLLLWRTDLRLWLGLPLRGLNQLLKLCHAHLWLLCLGLWGQWLRLLHSLLLH